MLLLLLCQAYLGSEDTKCPQQHVVYDQRVHNGERINDDDRPAESRTVMMPGPQLRGRSR